MLRGLFNVRPLELAGNEFLQIQDEYLQEESRQKGVTDIADSEPIAEGISLRSNCPEKSIFYFILTYLFDYNIIKK